VLLIKLTDLQAAAVHSPDRSAQLEAQETLQRVHHAIAQLQAKNPSMVVIDPLNSIQKLLDRAEMQCIMQKMHVRCVLSEEAEDAGGVAMCSIPEAFLYQPADTSGAAAAAASSTAAADSFSAIATPVSPSSSTLPILSALPASLRFPVICKSIRACGSPTSHRMFLLQRREDFALMQQRHAAATQQPASAATAEPASSGSIIQPSPITAPIWLVQRFVPHSGVLYKVYVLGDEIFITPKVSETRRTANAGTDIRSTQ
jgi:hypothetical protein